MNEIRLVNDNGYKALRTLARGHPQVFMSPDPDRLRNAMISEAATKNVWRKPLKVGTPLAPLNEVSEQGPGTDAHYSKIMREALADISLAQAADELLWASINCFAIAHYVPKRWATSNMRQRNPEAFVDNHWLKGGPDGRQSNAAARLWWLGEISERVARYSKYTSDQLLNAMANNVNLYHQTLDRRYLIANPRLIAAIYECALDGNIHLFQTQYANQLFKSLNVRAGAQALDLMDDDELRSVVEDATPPKE